MLKNEAKFLRVEERVKRGEVAGAVCEEMGLDPHALYAWRSRMKKKVGAKVIVHHAKATKLPKKTKQAPTGYMVFGTPEFLKQFMGAT
jgi:transposase-like protein